MKHIFVGLGSNVGDRLAFLRSAVRELGRLEGTGIVQCSSVYETEPVGKTDQAYFLNAVVELSSDLGVTALQRECRTIETLLGRTKTERWGPREIDLDLLLFGRSRVAVERPAGLEGESALREAPRAGQPVPTRGRG